MMSQNLSIKLLGLEIKFSECPPPIVFPQPMLLCFISYNIHFLIKHELYSRFRSLLGIEELVGDAQSSNHTKNMQKIKV